MGVCPCMQRHKLPSSCRYCSNRSKTPSCRAPMAARNESRATSSCSPCCLSSFFGCSAVTSKVYCSATAMLL